MTSIGAVRGLEPISSLSPEQISELVAQSRLESLEPGMPVLRSGKPERQAVYLLRGDIELHVGNGKRQVISAGSAEALHPIASEESLSATAAVTASRVTILRVDADLLDRLLTWAQISVPEEAVVMSEDRIITVNKAGWLKTMLKSPTFRNLPPANVEELLHRLEPTFAGAGKVVIRQGDHGDYFYMIDDGVVLVTHNPDDDEDSIVMAELNKGDTFGEAALLTDNPRNATVSMMTDGILLRLSKEDFNKLLRAPTLQWLDFKAASACVAEGAIWTDVRLPSEYRHSRLPGAINVPMPTLHRMARELDRKRRYICYCQTGQRSSAAAFVLKQYGLDACVLDDGLQHVDAGRLQHD